MEKFKHLKSWVPELYLVGSVIFYYMSAATLLNPIAFFLFGVLVALFIWKSGILGTLISSLCLILSLFMVLALISEVNEFPEFNRDAQLLFFVGLIWLGLNIILSVFMMIKWIRLSSASQTAVSI